MNLDSFKPLIERMTKDLLLEIETLAGLMWGNVDARQIGVLRDALATGVSEWLLSWLDQENSAQHERNVGHAINIIESEATLASLRASGVIRQAFQNVIMRGASAIVGVVVARI